jgi:8-oxo-dGTP pyrophosphatase MutT (NUDIX family)
VTALTARMMAVRAAYEGVEVAGLAIVAGSTARVLLARRAYDETDESGVRETWEFPGGHLDDGEDPIKAAMREFSEEIGLDLPAGEVINGWRAGDEDQYQGFVYLIRDEFDLSGFTPNEEVSEVGWFDREAVEANENLRAELKEGMDWSLIWDVSGNEEMKMADESQALDEETAEPDLSLFDLASGPIPIHGVLAPEDVESGDSRGFNSGAMTARPYRLPFMWQEQQNAGHDKSVVVGSVDRLMRKDGMIHWQGALMPSAKAGEFTELLAFFGRFGVSVDGDKGSMDAERTNATSVMWFDAVRAAGLTAVAIPAFAEAYVAFGPHPEMPEEDSEEFAVLRASGDAVTFDRGPGWVTHPKETRRLHAYWTQKGQPGYAKIAWGTPGDFRRARVLIGEKIGANSPEDMRYLNQIIAQWHHDALGYWPGELDKPGNKTSAEAEAERKARRTSAAIVDDGETWEEVLVSSPVGEFRDVSTEERKDLADEGAAMPDGSYPIANCSDLKNAIQAIGRAKDPEAVKRHIRKRKSALGCDEVDLPDTWSTHDLVLTASAGVLALPPASYFDRHEDTGALVIEEPDENGLRRTYGYAGEWGVCHIGFDGRCVEVPDDPTGEFREFHLGRTKTADGYLNTGLITYKVKHRNARQILTETAEQAHYDNIENAWCAVRLGTDDRGVWFSGVVLPHVPEEDIVLIEAAGQVSGEWKYGALRGLQCVNIPGFAVMRSSAAYDPDGNVIALSASAIGTSDCAPSPAERMEALRVIDAEVRMTRLRQNWGS